MCVLWVGMDTNDDRVVIAIEEIRAEHQACSLGMLSARLGVNREIVRYYCNALRAEGRIDWSPQVHGSIHVVTPPADLRRQLLLELVLEDVERMSALEDGSDLSVWCTAVLLEATQRAWPPAPSVGDVALETAVVDESVTPRCDLCDRTFKTANAVIGHERSNAHRARLAEQLGLETEAGAQLGGEALDVA